MADMSMGAGLAIYLVVIIIIFVVFYLLIGLNIFPSLVLSLLIGILVLTMLFPATQLSMMNSESTAATLISIIYILTVLIILFYILYTALRDFRHGNVNPKYEKFVQTCTGAGCFTDQMMIPDQNPPPKVILKG